MHTPHSNARGAVLIIVLWASLGLVSVALLFGHSMLMAYRGSDNELAGRQAEQAIEGAARYAESILTNTTTPGVLPDSTTYENEAVPVGEATFWMLGRSLQTDDTKTRTFGLVDEASKLNLNTATVAMLMQLPGMTQDFATAIVQWRTAAVDGATGGPATATTASSTTKGAPFESIEELALVTGATRELLFGEDANLNGVLDAAEDDGGKSLPADNSDGKLDPGILEYVTVFSRESNRQGDGTARINVADMNAATAALTTLINDKIGTGRAQQILALARQGGPLRSVLEFYIRTRSVLKADEFGKIADALTTRPGDTVQGLVNVNTASATVLACIMGRGIAEKLVSARGARTQTDTGIAWIVDAIGEAAARDAGPLITGKTSQVCADIAAVGRHGRGYRRTRFVIDNSTGTPRVIFRRNLSQLGWALGSDIRADLAANGRKQ